MSINKQVIDTDDLHFKVDDQDLSDVFKNENVIAGLKAAERLNIPTASFDKWTFLKKQPVLIISFLNQLDQKYPLKSLPLPEYSQQHGGEFENMIKSIGKEAEERRDAKMKNVI